MRDDFENKLFEMAAEEKMILPESMNKKINDTIVIMGSKRHVFRMTWKKSIVLAVVLVTVMSFTVSAAVSALRERMEAMNEQEMEDYFVQIYTSKVTVYNYNRAYMDGENQRKGELNKLYEEEALFPKGVLTMISEPEEYKGKGVAFYGDTSTFFLPEKEMSDEELLQIIDFMHKCDYSLQKMNEMIAEGEMTFPSEEIKEKAEAEKELTDSVILESDAIWEPSQELTIPYTGNLEIRCMAAGRDCIFLMGYNAIHKMEIGSGDSELFFDDFDAKTDISALYQAKNGDIYIAVLTRVDNAGDANDTDAADNAGDANDADAADDTDKIKGTITMGGEEYNSELWILSEEGEIKKKIDLTPYSSLGIHDLGIGLISRMVVDEQGYIYIRTCATSEKPLMVLDSEGNYVKDIISDLDSPYCPHRLAGLGIGKDGKVYTQVVTDDLSDRHMGIASVNLEEGRLEDIYMDIVPQGTIMLDIIAPGSETDFVFWGYDGIFTYNLGDESAVNVLPAYEAPCTWEGVLYCALPDGRIVFGGCSEYDSEKYFRIPEKVCFYYKSTCAQ